MADLVYGQAKAPWHLWVVGGLSLVWNVLGALTIIMAQTGSAMDMDANEIAYYAAQPGWFRAVTDVVLISAVLAAVALLMRSRWAVHLYALSVAGFVVAAAYDAYQGTALFLDSQEWLVLECVTFALSLLQLFYALAMKSRGVLR